MILSNLITAKVNLLAGIVLGISICIINNKVREKLNDNKENDNSTPKE